MVSFPLASALDGMYLKPLEDSDADALHAITNHPKIADIITFLSYPVPHAMAVEWIKKNEGDKARVYGIFSNDEVLTGQIGAFVSDTPNEIEIGYWIGVDFWGKGVATQALSAFAKTLQHLNLDYKIVAECLPHNASSMRVLEKAGFLQTGQSGHRAGCTRLIYAT